MARSSKYSTAFIDEAKIHEWLEKTRNPEPARVREVIAKAREAQGLSPEEAAVLLQVEDDELLAEIFAAAREVKERIYGRRVVIFAPLYLSNYCINSCTYCGYRRRNQEITRRKLSQEEIAEQTRILIDMGHKRVAIEAGEDPRMAPIEYILESIETIYRTTSGRNSIRRVNVNIAATTVEEYRLLKEADIGTYILFQETYHRETYRRVHLAGPKADYDWHTTAMHRAMEAGIGDVSVGVLFGLYDYRFEVLALLLHAAELERVFGAGPHAVSVPRLREAAGVDLNNFPYLLSDRDFRKVVAIIRLALPYAGLILSTREKPEDRDELIALGVSQMSAGSCTGVGGYRRPGEEERAVEERTEQFTVHDNRSHDEVVRSICRAGYLPSYCTACYRSGRTGPDFMRLAKPGRIQELCLPNAILTFKEYLLDYASPQTRAIGEEVIAQQLSTIADEKLRLLTQERLKRIEAGERDIYF